MIANLLKNMSVCSQISAKSQIHLTYYRKFNNFNIWNHNIMCDIVLLSFCVAIYACNVSTNIDLHLAQHPAQNI